MVEKISECLWNDVQFITPKETMSEPDEILQSLPYLPAFVLGLDHFLVREGFPVIHEHVLQRRAVFLFGEQRARSIYQLALQRLWVQRQEVCDRQYQDDRGRVNVWLVEENDEVQCLLRKRNHLIEVLYRKAKHQALTHAEFWSKVESSKRFLFKQDDKEEWIALLLRDGLLKQNENALRLDLESRLLQRLLGRMNIWGVVLALRILRGNSPERQKTVAETVDAMVKVATHGNRELAEWAIEYAQTIKLVEIDWQETSEGGHETIYLKRHRFVHMLDQREAIVCQALSQLVRRLSQHSLHGGWLPRPLVLQAMAEDSIYGYCLGEYDYWLNQATHRKILERLTERQEGHAPHNYLRVPVQ
ncbi:hypothetical protein [Tengunoibacter tsumagoiensis]|uniref:Uncharacterized protein n=1 Tax=Tengunoibacter tsumagoiensis TaxID=2014871 RepID=A0A402A104_9CHLR|nr:hypothetical protein [Tengunoibacter tsumagoiensis]GCE12803.1 hypothetical protein KTT_26620 [Tengunoibacter tsumagoiensis]